MFFDIRSPGPELVAASLWTTRKQFHLVGPVQMNSQCLMHVRDVVPSAHIPLVQAPICPLQRHLGLDNLQIPSDDCPGWLDDGLYWTLEECLASTLVPVSSDTVPGSEVSAVNYSLWNIFPPCLLKRERLVCLYEMNILLALVMSFLAS